MEFVNLLLLQFIAHLLADYTFQSKKMAHKKDKKGFKSKQLKWHVLIVFICSAVLGLHYEFLPAALFISLTHWIIDGLKPKLLKNPKTHKYAFFIDQTLHLIVMVTTIYFYTRFFEWNPLFDISIHTFYVSIIGAFLFCTKPANILIREIFNAYEIYFEGGDEDLPNAGRLIGIVERWLVLLFIIVGQFAAVGFLIGAK